MKNIIFILIFAIVLSSCNMYSKNNDVCKSGSIAFYSIDHSQSPLSKSISLINISNKKVTEFKTNGVYQIALSPKGDKIAFSQIYLDTNGVDLVLLDISTEKTSRVENKFDDYHPVWSPTGDEILYISGPEFSFELYKLDVNLMDSLLVSLPFSDDYKYVVPLDWKQDYILFRGQSNSEINSSNDKLILFQPNKNEWHVIYESSSNILTALFSPVDAILLVEEGGDQKNSYNLSSIFFYDWENNKKISTPDIQGRSRFPDWSPDGKCIAYLYNNEIRIYSLVSKKVSTFYTFLDKNFVILDIKWWGIN
jgi:Tol biopolymer transport system component